MLELRITRYTSQFSPMVSFSINNGERRVHIGLNRLLCAKDQYFRESVIDKGLSCNNSLLHGFYFPKQLYVCYGLGNRLTGQGHREFSVWVGPALEHRPLDSCIGPQPVFSPVGMASSLVLPLLEAIMNS